MWHGLTPPYDAIVADPPWRFITRSPKGVTARAADAHYPCMDLASLSQLPVQWLAAKNCHLWLWTPAEFLQHALRLMSTWGFRYSSTGFVWVKIRSRNDSKPRIGKGYTTRKSCEFCLLGRRGQPKRHDKGIEEVILDPIREHSRKPEEARERIARYCGKQARIVELFARHRFGNWDRWGNELAKFDEVA